MNVYYDTTFCLGDFYVSTLAFQHIMFKDKKGKRKVQGVPQSQTAALPRPQEEEVKSWALPIPVAFMVHERKFQKCNEEFIEIIKTKVPKLSNKAVCVITDRETGIVNAFEKCLESSQILICWNHILRDLKIWLNSHGGSSADKQVYGKHVKTLLHYGSAALFQEKYAELKVLWSEAMVTYFEQNLYETMQNYSGRWVLEKYNNYNPYSGITNNCAESINAKLKRLVEYKEKEIDSIVLYLYYLQSNDLSDLIGGFCGESEWTLLNKFSTLYKIQTQ